MSPGRSGKFVVIDSIDGAGKGSILSTFVEEAKRRGKRVFDVQEYWQEHDWHPPVSEIIGKYHAIVTAEPTFVGIGKIIREEYISNQHTRKYSPQIVAEAYALDRRILYEQLLLPLLDAGVDVYQSRSFSTSVVYQPLSASQQGLRFSMHDVLRIPGNAFCLQRPMDFLLIPMAEVSQTMQRLAERKKKDNCVFENVDFQTQAKEKYLSDEFQQLFKDLGSSVHYLDTSMSVEFTLQQAREFFEKFLV